MNVGPYIGFFYPLYKKGGLGVQKKFITSFWHFLAIKMADFLKLEIFLRPFL